MEDRLRRPDPGGYITRATELSPEHPGWSDRFSRAIEIDVDALAMAARCYIERGDGHIEEAGIHSGDSRVLAARSRWAARHRVRASRHEAIAHGIGVVGLLNVQYALKDDVLYDARGQSAGSRTVPFVSKGHGGAAGQGVRAIMLGATIAQLREGVLVATGRGEHRPNAPIAVKERCCRSTGSQRQTARGGFAAWTGDEVDGRGHGQSTRLRHRSRQEPDRAYGSLPARARWFVSVANRDKRSLVGSRSSGSRIGFGAGPPMKPRDASPQRHPLRRRAQNTFEEPSPDRPAMSAVDAIRAGAWTW